MPVAILMSMRVQVAPCDRYRLRVTSWGSGAPPHAIVLPGISADWRSLAPQIHTLRRLGLTVHVVDLPGFALRPALKASDANVAQLAEYVARAVAGLGIPPALVLGHSLGGGVAMNLAIAHPELVTGLVLIAPVGLGVSLHWIYKLYCVPLLGRALMRPSVLTPSAIRRFLVGRKRRDDARFIARIARHGMKARDRALSARAIIWANQPRRWRKARALLPGGEQLGIRVDGRFTELGKIPALVLWGDEDRIISASDARRCKELPLAQVHIVHGVGHSLPLEVAGWANDHIVKFVTALTKPEKRAA
jgi:pyruvate dehydrogenase E2 component (dihydrolipoamide acetyltransferase)